MTVRVWPWNCSRHSWWQGLPGSSTWTDAEISRRGGGAQHKCAECGGWIYCSDWSACPGPEVELSVYDKKRSRHTEIVA